MSELEEVQAERQRLIERRNEIHAARDRGEDWDAGEMTTLQSRIDMLGHQIRELGGDPDATPPADTPSTGSTPPADEPSSRPAPDPNDPVGTARARLEELRGAEPHPGVRLGPDNTVVGGTPEQLQENLRWRAELGQAEQDLAVAEAEQAFEDGGGLDSFTSEERREVERLRAEIDRLRAEDERVQGEIDPLEENLAEARGQLEANRGQSGGPGAGAAGAIGAGEATNARLRPLYEEQARIRARIAELTNQLGEVAKSRIRHTIERGGGGVELPPDRAGREAVETELLRRILERLGVRDVSPDGAGLFARPRRRPGLSLIPTPALVALVAVLLIAFVGLLVALWATGGDDTDDLVAAGSDDSEATGPQPPADPEPGDQEPGDQEPDPEPEPVGPATRVGLGGICPQVLHQPPPGSSSLSTIVVSALVVPLDGTAPDDAEVTIDLGGDGPGSSQLSHGIANVKIGISSYGTYEPRSVTVASDGTPLEIRGSLPPVVVGPEEGPVDDCTPADQLSEAERQQVVDEVQITDFVHALDEAHDAGDTTTLFDTLDQATIERYGAEACRTYLDDTVGSFDDPVIHEVRPEPWSYETDGLSIDVDGSWTVEMDLMLGGEATSAEMHLRVDDSITWFTDCGEPDG